MKLVSYKIKILELMKKIDCVKVEYHGPISGMWAPSKVLFCDVDFWFKWETNESFSSREFVQSPEKKIMEEITEIFRTHRIRHGTIIERGD